MTLAFCWAHCRRKFYEIAEAGHAPIAEEALKRIAAICAIEDHLRGQPPEARRAGRPGGGAEARILTQRTGPSGVRDFEHDPGEEECPDAQEALHGRADRICAETGGGRHCGGRDLPQDGVSEATFYRWKKVYAGMGVAEIRRLKQLEDENGKLKRLVADLSLDKEMLQDALRRKW